jgi:hypothetical protein
MRELTMKKSRYTEEQIIGLLLVGLDAACKCRYVVPRGQLNQVFDLTIVLL